MSKKLLSESTIRKFMKFANIDGLADTFLKEGAYMEEGEYMEEMEDHSMEEGAYMEEADMEPGDEDLEAAADMEAAAADDMEEPEEEMDAMADGEIPADVRPAVEKAIESALDAMFAELEKFGIAGEAEVVDDMPAGEMDMEEPEEEMDMEVIDEEAIVNETLSRVTARLRSMKAEAKADSDREAFAERIAEAVASRLRK